MSGWACEPAFDQLLVTSPDSGFALPQTLQA